jgi:hypothetical protein
MYYFDNFVIMIIIIYCNFYQKNEFSTTPGILNIRLATYIISIFVDYDVNIFIVVSLSVDVFIKCFDFFSHFRKSLSAETRRLWHDGYRTIPRPGSVVADSCQISEISDGSYFIIQFIFYPILVFLVS